MVSKFTFLQPNYPELFTISELAEKLYYVDPSSSLAKSRLFTEKLAQLIWQFEDLEVFNGNQVERINQLFYKNCILLEFNNCKFPKIQIFKKWEQQFGMYLYLMMLAQKIRK